jgi:hypothetical protein
VAVMIVATGPRLTDLTSVVTGYRDGNPASAPYRASFQEFERRAQFWRLKIPRYAVSSRSEIPDDPLVRYPLE